MTDIYIFSITMNSEDLSLVIRGPLKLDTEFSLT